MKKDQNSFFGIRGSEQRISRRDFLGNIPQDIRTIIINAEYYLSPEREEIIMDLLDKQSKRNKFTKNVNDEKSVLKFVSNFKRIPDKLFVYVWSSLDYGPVYKFNLKWALENFQYLWNQHNNYDLNLVSENGKIGMMISPNHDPQEYGYFIVTKWGLI